MLRIGPVSTSMFLTDALGSLVATTDSAGGVQSEVTYEPFGGTELSSPAPAYRFTGREHDEPMYLYYYRARYYHTDLQRFISEDPISFGGGDPNLYAYVANNPMGRRDPLGLQAVPIPGPVPIPVPFPPVFIPGTPENEAFVQATRNAIEAASAAISTS